MKAKNELSYNFKPVKKSKYRNIPVYIDEIRFHSKKEGKYYQELKLRKLAGDIIDFRRQVPIHFISNITGKKLFTYFADFVTYEKDDINGIKETIIDVKGCRTPIYKLKKLLIEEQHQKKIIEI